MTDVRSAILERKEKFGALLQNTNQADNTHDGKNVAQSWSNFTNGPGWGDWSKGSGGWGKK